MTPVDNGFDREIGILMLVKASRGMLTFEGLKPWLGNHSWPVQYNFSLIEKLILGISTPVESSHLYNFYGPTTYVCM